MTSARLFNEVLALPPEERREFALRVLETVDDPIPPEIEEAHYQEVLRRLHDVDEGREELVPSEDVESGIHEKLRRARMARALP